MVYRPCAVHIRDSARSRAQGYGVVDPITIEALRKVLPNQSKECVMDVLGISSQTWTKMK